MKPADLLIENAAQVLTGNAHKLRESRTQAQEHSIIFGEEFVNGLNLSNDAIDLKRYAQAWNARLPVT